MPCPSWSARKKTRAPIHIGVARLPLSVTSGTNFPSPARSIQMVPAVPPRYRFQRAGSPELRPITTPGPFGSYAIARAGPTRSAVEGPPATGTAWRWA